MDDRLQEFIEELGNAISETLSDSEKLETIIGDIRKNGYDVFLVIEATVGFNKHGSANLTMPSAQKEQMPMSLNFTAQDQAFLKALKINVEEDPSTEL